MEERITGLLPVGARVIEAARAARWVRALLLVELCAFALSVAGTHGAFAPQPVPPTTTDFASFYSAGLLADRGRAAEAYDRDVLLATGRGAIHPGVTFNPFLNPPVFLLVCAPLAALPYLPAFVLFEGVTAALWLGMTTRIAGGGRLAAMALAAIPSAWWALGWGQNSFLSGKPYGIGARFGWAAGRTWRGPRSARCASSRISAS